MSDTDRVLKMLRERGPRGLNPSDVLSGLPDGGKPIQRLAARVRELRAAGWGIESCRQSNGTSTYILVSDLEFPHRAAPLTDGGYARDSTGRGPRLTEASSGTGGRTECMSGNPAVHSSATEIPGVGHAGEGRAESLFEVPPVGKPGWADVESAA